MNLLNLTMQGWMARPHRWGQDDCILAPLDWVSAVLGGGLDLAGDLRLTYASYTEAQREYRFFTDPMPMAQKYLERRAGLGRRRVAARGDVVLFKWPSPSGAILPTAGICIQPGLFGCRGDPNPVWLRPRDFMGVWAVGYEDA